MPPHPHGDHRSAAGGARTAATLSAVTLALLLCALGSRRAVAQSTVLPTPPVVPLWQQWFDALNHGEVAAVRALMVMDEAAPTGDGTAALPYCAGGCEGMAAIDAAVDELIADGYWGRIDAGSVQVSDTTVTFDVIEVSGGPPAYDVRTSQWTMEVDGALIAPACPAVCLRSPTDRAAQLAAQPTTPSTAVIPPANPTPTLPYAVTPRVLPTKPVLAPAPGPVEGGTDATPARGVVAGLVAGLLIIMTSIGIDLWRCLRHTGHARP